MTNTTRNRAAIIAALACAASLSTPALAAHATITQPAQPCVANGMFWDCGYYTTASGCEDGRRALGHAPQQPNLPLQCSYRADLGYWQLKVPMV